MFKKYPNKTPYQVATLPDIQQEKPRLNPMELYKSLGINAQPQNGVYVPADYNSLKTGIENKLNFGDRNLANLYKTVGYNQDSTISGIGQNQNYGSPMIANLEKQQGFLPQVLQNVSNEQPEQATVTENSVLQDVLRTEKPEQQKGFFQNYVDSTPNKVDDFALGGVKKVGGFLNSPAGRALLVAGLGMAAGGGGLMSATAGLKTYANIKNSQNEDSQNRKMLEGMGVDLTGITGYVSDKNAKQFIDAENAKFSQYYKNRLLGQDDKKLGLQERDMLRKEGYTDAQIELIEANIEKAGATTENLNAKTETENLMRDPKLKNLLAKTGYTVQKTTESKTLTPLKANKIVRDTNKPYFKPTEQKPEKPIYDSVTEYTRDEDGNVISTKTKKIKQGQTPPETKQYQGFTYIKGTDGKWHRQG